MGITYAGNIARALGSGQGRVYDGGGVVGDWVGWGLGCRNWRSNSCGNRNQRGVVAWDLDGNARGLAGSLDADRKGDRSGCRTWGGCRRDGDGENGLSAGLRSSTGDHGDGGGLWGKRN